MLAFSRRHRDHDIRWSVVIRLVALGLVTATAAAVLQLWFAPMLGAQTL